MRARKAVAPVDDASVDDLLDTIPADEQSVQGANTDSDLDRVCLLCGAANSKHDGCAHPEVARFSETSRVARHAIVRLRQAAAERRAAERALRTLVASEAGRGRAEFEPVPVVEQPAAEPGPCTRCAARAAEEQDAYLQALMARKSQKKPRTPSDAQGVFPFASTPR